MTTFIKTKLKKSDYLTNIDIYRVAANITKYHSIPKVAKIIFLRVIIQKIHVDKAIISCNKFM